MKFSSRQPEPANMQLAPMIDIVFLLLIFFIVTWQFTRSETELSVSVPTAQEGADPQRQQGEIVINILSDGAIKVEGSMVDLPQLLEKLASIAAQYENQPVRIRGDGGVAYQRIVEVIDTCQKAGIWNISFATQKPAPNN
ncbi:biopolymer transporter ExbD [Akkermansiaceae bacterium]|nr:biopolymer transporter ExbD [Akkermansiaceae bacterium]